MRPLHRISDFFNVSLATSLHFIPAFEAPLAGCSRLLFRVSDTPLTNIIRERLQRQIINRAKEHGDTYRTVVLPSKARLVVDITSWGFGNLYFDGRLCYEPQTTQFIMTHLPRGGTFVDVGANVGYFSLLAAGIVGSEGMVYAFEPNTGLHNIFMRSVHINSFENRVHLSEVALSNVNSEKVDFFTQLGNSGVLSTLTPWEGHLDTGALSLTHKISVPARRLDSWIKEAGISRIDILKIDVEG